jgi:hypothetical protein
MAAFYRRLTSVRLDGMLWSNNIATTKRRLRMSEIKKLWHFRQNNSGGFYTGPAYNIIVEADGPNEAWDKAQALGATNDGSCECCGPYRIRRCCSAESATIFLSHSFSNASLLLRYCLTIAYHRAGLMSTGGRTRP